MKKSYTIGRTPQELRTAVEILIRNDFFELENISVKHDDTEGHAFALILKGDTFQDTIFMDIISGEQTTLTYTYSCEDAAIPARLSQLNQKLSEVLDAAEYKDEIEGETPKQPVPEAEPKPEKTSDQLAAKPAVHDYHKWILLALRITAGAVLVIGLILAIQGASDISYDTSYSLFYDDYTRAVATFDAYFFFDTLLVWIFRAALIFVLAEIYGIVSKCAD